MVRGFPLPEGDSAPTKARKVGFQIGFKEFRLILKKSLERPKHLILFLPH